MADQALTIRFKTDLAGAQNSIAKFASDTAANLARIAQGSYNAKKALDLISESGSGIKLGLGIAAGAFAAVEALKLIAAGAAAARAGLDELVKIGTGAAAAGVGTSFFQAWIGQAEALKLSTADLVAMLEKAREASTETIGENGQPSSSPGRNRLRRNVLAGNLGGGALSSFDSAGTQEERDRVILGLLDQMIAKSDKLAAFDLAKTFFGDKFEAQLRNGADMIGKMRASLDGLEVAGGARIIPESEIRNAQDLDKRLQDISNRIALGMKPVMEAVVAVQQDMLAGLILVKNVWLDIIEVAGKLVNLAFSVAQEMRNIRAEIKDALGLAVELPTARPQGHPGEDAAVPALTVRGDRSRSLPSLTPKAAKTAATPTDEVETYIKSLEKLAAAEKAEADTLGLGNKAKQEAVDLARALEAARARGTPLTAKETEQVKQLADAYVGAKDKIEAYAKAQEDAKATADFFGQTLEGTIERLATSGESLKSALKDIVKLLEQAAIKALVLGEGPLAGLFGTAGSGAAGTAGLGGIFGQLFNLLPGFASGGNLASGQYGIAGESGPELIQGPGTVTPFRQISAALNSGGGRGGVSDNSRTFHVDARGAQAGVADQIVSALEQYDARLSRNLPVKIAIADRRFG